MWWWTRSALAVAVVAFAACGSEPNDAARSVATPPGEHRVTTPSTASLTTDSTEPSRSDSIGTEIPPDVGWVEIVVTGVVGRSPEGAAELCPFAGACFGIPIDGEIDEALDGQYVRVSGLFDGVALMPGAPPQEVPSPNEERSYVAMCDDDVPTGGRLDPVAEEAIGRYLDTVPDAHAGTWIDTPQRVMTYWFVGDDVTEHDDAISGLANGAAVCVTGGARWSRTQLQSAADQVSEILQPDATAGSSWGVHETDNVVTVNVRVLDPALRGDLDALADRLKLTAFIELPDAPREHLPPLLPVVAGDLAILTQRDGGRNGEDALGRFLVRFDTDRNCVWFEPPTDRAEGTRRFVPVWPDGYTATSDPLVIRDFDGIVVANEGDVIELGGGYHDPSSLELWSDGTADCGADGTDAMFVVTR